MKHIKTALRYIKFLFSARNTRGHGIHSPYIFDFVQTVLCGQNPYYIFSQIEKVRNTLLENDKTLNISDFGAGKSRKQSVKSIAKRSLKSPRFAQLLFRAVHYSKSVNVLELGTSLGITTAYLAASNSKIRCITLEGSAEIAAVARENWNRLKIKNIECVVGNIDETLQNIVNQHFEIIDFVFIDANHKYEAVIQYFNVILPKLTENSIVVFDDIYWSDGMVLAWNEIKKHPKVTATIDLFQIGIVFFNKNLTKKEYKIINL